MTNPETKNSPVKPFDQAAYDDTRQKLDKYFTFTGGFDYEAWDDGLPPDHAGVLASKHRGHLDPPLLAVVAHYEYDRRVRFLAAQRLLEGRMGPLYNKFFHQLGCIMLDTASTVALDKQPAGQEVKDTFAAKEILGIFPEGEIYEGPILPEIRKTHKIGPIAINYQVPVTAVGVSGTEFKPGQWLGPKYVVLGRTSHPDLDKLSQLDPEDRADQWELIKYSKALSGQVHSYIQEATTMAERARSKKHFAVSRPKNTPKRRRPVLL